MVSFPDISPQHPEDINLEFLTLVTEFDNGEENAKQKRLFPRRKIKLRFAGKSIAEARTLWTFYIARGGKFGTFNYFSPFSNVYAGEYVATGDGTTASFNLPSKLAADFSVYIDGVEQTENVDYIFTASGGADGADLLSFIDSVRIPEIGERITFDFTGILKIKCRFADDFMNFQTFYNRIVNSELTLQGLLNA